MMIVSALSHPGTVRENNEDAILSDPRHGLIAIADGMGGHRAGEVASRIALNAIQAFVAQTAENDDFTWPCAIDPALSHNANRLNAAMKMANRAVFQKSEEDPTYNGMGTTVVAALIENSIVTFSAVGDSRLYELSNGDLRQLTRDDSLIEAIADQGLGLSELQAQSISNVLTNVIGTPRELIPTVFELPLQNQHLLLLCTDGLHRALSRDAMTAVLQEEPDLARAAQTLISTAVERDGSDNVTVLLVRYLT